MSELQDLAALLRANTPLIVIETQDEARVVAFYDGAGVQATVQPFFSDVPERMAEAQLVITRAGASTVADLSVIGRPAILVPLAAAIRDEQTANARALVDAGAAVLIPEKRLDAATLEEHIRAILDFPEGAAQMARAALSTGKPDATARLVALVEGLAGQDMVKPHGENSGEQV